MLPAADGNKTKAAKNLKIGRTSLYEKIQKYNIPL
jgi:transcriptional regulator with PAS, ATPase and Fis domain